MNRYTWLQQKKQFLSDYFSKRNDGNIKVSIQENTSAKQNTNSAVNQSWASLMEQSKGIHCFFVLSSLDANPSGFKTDNTEAQHLLDSAFNKKVGELFDIADEDETEIIKENLLDYMIANRLYKKNLDVIIQKLKNIDSEELQNFT
jgi:hypothetical protein